jgi:hypothetical protein
VSGPARADRVRRILTVAAAVGQVVLPTLLPPRFAPGQEPPEVMQPAPATFAVWLPIFATSLAHAAVQARPSSAADPTLRRIGWPAAAAYGATAAWAPLVASRRYRSAQAALFAIAGFAEVARRRLAAAEAQGVLSVRAGRAGVTPVAMLAGWGAAASTVNLAAMLVAGGAVRPGRPSRVTGAALTAGTAAIGMLAARSAEGGIRTASARAYLATVAWALAGIAAGQIRRSPAVGATALIGLAAVGSTLGASLRPAGGPRRTSVADSA